MDSRPPIKSRASFAGMTNLPQLIEKLHKGDEVVVTPYKRSTRVSGEVYIVIAEVCRNELSDPRIKGVQLTSAEMTDDLQIVKVYYYVDGSEKDRKRSLAGLKSAKGYIRRAISERLKLRIVPEIRFYFDDGIENAEKLDKIFDDLKMAGDLKDR